MHQEFALPTLTIIAGSVRTASATEAVVEATIRSAEARNAVIRRPAIINVPPYGTCDENEAVDALRRAVAEAASIVIVSPEYAHSMPGTLKNALDWLVAGGELSQRPVAIISASSTHTGGLRAITALIQTLLAQSAYITAMLPISNLALKVDARGVLVHQATLRRITETVQAVMEFDPNA